MDDSEDDENDDQTLTNFWYGNVDERGKLEGGEYIPQLRREVAVQTVKGSCSH